MAHKLATPRIGVHPPRSTEDLRRVFETAVYQIHRADLAAKKKLEYHTPIAQRGKFLETSRAYAEKRALSDAAQALALLWKV